MLKIIITFAVFSLVSIPLAFAQTGGTIKGNVKDSTNGKPLPGVNVGIGSISKGAATDTKGHYEIDNIPEGTYKLSASFIGYGTKTKTVKVTDGGIQEVNFTLTSATQKMNQVVVTALGIKSQKQSIGTSQQSVSSEDIEVAPSVGVANKLSGQVSGLNIVSSSGQPGSATRIVIRGENSITGNNQPLFVIDGVPVSNASSGNPSSTLYYGSGSSRALDIDPSTIKNITVLKGGAATALYGSSASNGAILIETKSGTKGPVRINVSSTERFDKAIIKGQQNEYLAGINGHFSNGLPLDKGGYSAPGFPNSSPLTAKSWGPHKGEVSQQVLNALGVKNIKTYNHLKDFYQMGVYANNSINASGGSENGTYFISGSRIDQKGIVPTTSLTRTNFDLKVSRQILPKKLISNTKISYINDKNDRKGNGYNSAVHSLRLWPINLKMNPYQYSDGSLKHLGGSLGGSTYSPEWSVHQTGFRTIVNRIIIRQDLTYNVTPWMSISEVFGLDRYGQKQTVHRNQKKEVSHSGVLTSSKHFNSLLNNYIKLDINNINLTKKFELNAHLGNNIEVHRTSSTSVDASDQIVSGFFDPSNFKSRLGNRYLSARHKFSFYGELGLSYGDFLYLNLTGRNDWSSTLPKKNRSYFYPSASLSFVFSNLLNLDTNSPISSGKLRASIARTGNDAPLYSLSTNYLAPSYDQSMHGGAYGQTLRFPLEGISGYIQSSTLGNPNLKPERTKSFEVGVDLSFMKNRVGIHATYYKHRTFNQIYPTSAPSSTGFSNVLRNAGEIRNRGTEITLNGTLIKSKEFNWTLKASWSKNISDVVSLIPGVDRIFLAGFSFPSVVASVGEGYGAIRGYAYKRNKKGELIIDDNPDDDNYGNPIESDQQKILGNIQPNWTGNILTTFHFRGFTLSGLLDIKDGGDIEDFSLNYTIRAGMAKITEKRGIQMTDPNKSGYIKPFIWKGVKASNGKANDIKVLRNENFWEQYSLIHENQVKPGGYIKLRRVSLGYKLPQSILKNTPIRNASFTVTGRNLWIKTKFPTGDPEGSLYGSGNGGTGYYLFITPSSRSILFSLKLGF